MISSSTDEVHPPGRSARIVSPPDQPPARRSSFPSSNAPRKSRLSRLSPRTASRGVGAALAQWAAEKMMMMMMMKCRPAPNNDTNSFPSRRAHFGCPSSRRHRFSSSGERHSALERARGRGGWLEVGGRVGGAASSVESEEPPPSARHHPPRRATPTSRTRCDREQRAPSRHQPPPRNLELSPGTHPSARRITQAPTHHLDASSTSRVTSVVAKNA